MRLPTSQSLQTLLRPILPPSTRSHARAVVTLCVDVTVVKTALHTPESSGSHSSSYLPVRNMQGLRIISRGTMEGPRSNANTRTANVACLSRGQPSSRLRLLRHSLAAQWSHPFSYERPSWDTFLPRHDCHSYCS